MHDYSVQVLLSGDFDDAYTDGDNSKVVPTDTVKNTCYFIADKVSFASPEEYAVALGKHFLQTYLLLLLLLHHLLLLFLSILLVFDDRKIQLGGEGEHRCHAVLVGAHELQRQASRALLL